MWRRGYSGNPQRRPLSLIESALSRKGVLPRLVQVGKDKGFLTDELSIRNDQNGGGKYMYLGVCRLPGEDRKYRRIAIYVTPYSEFPCMLLHFTGSRHLYRYDHHFKEATVEDYYRWMYRSSCALHSSNN